MTSPWITPARSARASAAIGLAALASAACSSASPAADAGTADAGAADAGEAVTASRWRAEEIAVGWSHSCARLADGSVWCWGSNKHGELGGGDQATILLARPTPMEVRGLSGVAELALGGGHTCARMLDGGVRCWGLNENGQLGDGTMTDRYAPAPVPDLAGVRRIAAGRAESCAVLGDGSARCWGGMPAPTRPTRRQPAPIAWSAAPAPVEGLSGVVAIALGTAHACALRKDGTVACWGENGKGQVGDTTTERRPLPVQVEGVAEAIQVTAWMSSSCALLKGGSVVCWGAAGGTDGVPQAAPELHDVAEIAGACARGADGSVRCRRGARLEVESGDAARIASGVAHACLIAAGGEARCWGANRSGELGDGTRSDHRRPTPVAW